MIISVIKNVDGFILTVYGDVDALASSRRYSVGSYAEVRSHVKSTDLSDH